MAALLRLLYSSGAFLRLVFILLLLSGCADPGNGQARHKLKFNKVQIDEGSQQADPWGKTASDLDGDNQIDLIVGNHGDQTLTVYYGPAWVKKIIASGEAFSTDVEVADVNSDGHADIIAITDENLLWFQGPSWTPSIISTRVFHDIELADLDMDGRIDIVARDQSAFGGNGNKLWIYYQQDSKQWHEKFIDIPDGEGLALGEFNNDRRIDIAVNGVWLENSGDRIWKIHRYSESWLWPNTVIATGDLNDDGAEDIFLTPSEPQGQRYHISWFENQGHPGIWPEHIVEKNVETILHTAAIGDVDLDGDNDLLVAAMHQGEDPDLITIYLNNNNGVSWVRQEVDDHGSHGAKFVDIDADSDLDIFGANWSGDNQEILVWENLTCSNRSQTWIRHELDKNRPGMKAPFVEVVDLDNDDLPDVITGGYWYRNPGNMNLDWQRASLGADQPDLVTTMDLGNDGDFDVLVLVDSAGGREFRWLLNTGKAEFVPLDTGITGSGDFLQGTARLPILNQEPGVALSWHNSGHAVELLRRAGAKSESWVLEDISEISQDEALSSGDIDADGDIDLLLGTAWIRNEGDGWTRFIIDSDALAPDRNVLADIDQDGSLDAVVGFESISSAGDLVWYRHNGDPTSEWERNLIATVVGPMSVGVADYDSDGDLDVFAGEHNLQKPADAALWVFENKDGSGSDWVRHLIYRGDEHHDGALTVDIDNDGDVDVVSIGWGHSKVIIYENSNTQCRRYDKSAGLPDL